MGGNVFAHASGSRPALKTPRMSPEKYQHLKTIYQHKLQLHLAPRNVSILTEAPEKHDYGDLDFVVESADEIVDWPNLARHLEAAALVSHNSPKVQRCSLAVPLDGSVSPIFYNDGPELDGGTANDAAEKYAQIDLEVVPTELFEWHSFYSSYGDMCGMLGHMVHNLGFTISDKGLTLRLVALDAAKDMKTVNVPDKSGRLFLSKNPQHILQFLGLSYDTYKQGFSRVDDLYRWLSKCRLLSKTSVKVKRDDASARQKEAKRQLYSTFFNEWLPNHFETGISTSSESDATPECPAVSTRRQDLALEAATHFDKELEYEQMNTTLVRQIQCQVVDMLLKPIISLHSGFETQKRAEIVRGFRRWVSFRDDQPYILSTPHDDQQSELHKWLDKIDWMKLQDEANVSEWVKENWEVIKGLERERGKMSKLPA